MGHPLLCFAQSRGTRADLVRAALAPAPDQPGGLSKILDVVDQAGINVEFMYAFTEKRENKAVLVFRFDDPDNAIKMLQQSKVNVVSSVDLLSQAEAR